MGLLQRLGLFQEPKEKTLHCPVCNHTEFLEGPSGGMAVNIQCCQCETKFWWGGPFRASIIELSEISREAGFEVGQEFAAAKICR